MDTLAQNCNTSVPGTAGQLEQASALERHKNLAREQDERDRAKTIRSKATKDDEAL